MKRILRKGNTDKGFTLAELLIVVAIIGVLVAIAIPVFGSQLKKAKDSTDVANLRAAYAEVVSSHLLEDGAGDSAPVTFQGDGTTTAWKEGKVGDIELKDVDHPGVGTKTATFTFDATTGKCTGVSFS